MVPWLVSPLVPPTMTWLPIVPAPRTSTFAPKVGMLLPSTLKRAFEAASMFTVKVVFRTLD